jgi:hypothetical protein
MTPTGSSPKSQATYRAEARIEVKRRLGDLRDALDFADVEVDNGKATPWGMAIRLNNLAHRVKVATENFGRTL